MSQFNRLPGNGFVSSDEGRIGRYYWSRVGGVAGEYRSRIGRYYWGRVGRYHWSSIARVGRDYWSRDYWSRVGGQYLRVGSNCWGRMDINARLMGDSTWGDNSRVGKMIDGSLVDGMGSIVGGDNTIGGHYWGSIVGGYKGSGVSRYNWRGNINARLMGNGSWTRNDSWGRVS